jgi:hypothetical protein
MTSYIKTMREAREEMLQAESMSAAQIDKLKKAYEPMRDKRISTANANKLSAMMDKFAKDKDVLIQLFKADIPFVSQSAVTKLIIKYNMKGAELNKLRERFGVESVELDEMKSKNYALAVKGKFVAVGSKADMRKMKKQKGGEVYMSPGAKVGGSPGKAEDVDLDEKLKFEGKFKVGDIIRSYDFKPMRDRKDNYIQGKIVKAGTMQQGAKVYEIKISNDSGKTSGDRVGDIGYVPMGVSSMEYDGRIVKVSDVKEEVEEGAAADARRAMRNDPDMKQRAFSKDVSSTDDDEKGASKNIMMQLRKAVSLRSYDVEFADGKKQKVDQKIAQAVQNKYNSMRRPADKEKFQAQIAKSYKDMLKTIKSGYGEQKESILEKIERKIKENKNG